MTVLLVGFNYGDFEAIADAGLDVRTLIHSHRLPRRPRPGVRYIHHSTLSHPFENAFAADLPRDVAAQARTTGFALFIRTHFRHFPRRRSFPGSWLNVNNYFENALQFYWTLLKEQEVTGVIYNNVPHLGSSIVLYHLCRTAGVPTLVCYQAPTFANRLLISSEIEGIGIAGPEADDGFAIPLDPDPRPPHYMSNVRRMTPLRFAGVVLSRLLKILAKSLAFSFLWHRRDYVKSICKVQEIWRAYRQHNRTKSLYSVFDPSVDYVYFPLHLQPEMATDVLGGLYCDQLLAIEELARHLPQGMRIYVKENPKQTSYMRDQSFYTRLKAIPGAHYLDIDVPSYELIRHSRGVATITGTVGWEALQMGKPVICFGSAWYRRLPGVWEWGDSGAEIVAKFLAFAPDMDALSDAVRQRSRLFWPGTINRDYAAIYPDFDEATNRRTLGASVSSVFRAVTADDTVTLRSVGGTG